MLTGRCEALAVSAPHFPSTVLWGLVCRFPWRRRCGQPGHPRCQAAPEEPQFWREGEGERKGQRRRWKDGELCPASSPITLWSAGASLFTFPLRRNLQFPQARCCWVFLTTLKGCFVGLFLSLHSSFLAPCGRNVGPHAWPAAHQPVTTNKGSFFHLLCWSWTLRGVFALAVVLEQQLLQPHNSTKVSVRRGPSHLLSPLCPLKCSSLRRAAVIFRRLTSAAAFAHAAALFW